MSLITSLDTNLACIGTRTLESSAVQRVAVRYIDFGIPASICVKQIVINARKSLSRLGFVMSKLYCMFVGPFLYC